MSTAVTWVREPTNRWMPCTGCRRSGRWLLLILGKPTGGPICDGCRVEMQGAWDSAICDAGNSR